MSIFDTPLPTIRSLRNMVVEMNRKDLELKRITKTAALLVSGGLSPNSIPPSITERCIRQQQPDGGWVGTVDTMWNAFFLQTINETRFRDPVNNALQFIRTQKNTYGLWGRSKRDMSRIPVTGLLLHFFPQLGAPRVLSLLEELWVSEKNSLTYKAAYTLTAFHQCRYTPRDKQLIPETVQWLTRNQNEDGGFSPWKGHPVDSDVYNTAVALLGLGRYPEHVPPETFENGFNWLVENRLETGIWKYHEIEDGASWGLYAITQLLKNNLVTG